MLELLETLNTRFQKTFHREVGMNEVTKFSLQLSAKGALVLTNSYLYVLRKRVRSVSCSKIPADEIKTMEVRDSRAVVLRDGGPQVAVEVDDGKKELVAEAAQKFMH